MKKKMSKKDMDEDCEMNNCCEGNLKCGKRSVCGGVYGVGFIGAAIYYISTASGFWMGVLGVLKALVWPAILVYKLLGFVGA